MLTLANGRTRLGGQKRGLRLFKAVGPVAPKKTYAEEVLADSPLAYWRLGESSGTTMVDSSGNGRDGTYGASTTKGTAGALIGDVNTAATNPTLAAGRCEVADAAWQTPASGFTVEAWVKPLPGSSLRPVIAKGGAVATSPWHLGYAASGAIRFAVRTTATTTLDFTIADNGSWHHLTGTWDGTTARLYADGTEVANGTRAGAMTTSSGILHLLGGLFSFGAGNPWSGAADEIALYDHALTPTRIAAHYTAGTAG